MSPNIDKNLLLAGIFCFEKKFLKPISEIQEASRLAFFKGKFQKIYPFLQKHRQTFYFSYI